MIPEYLGDTAQASDQEATKWRAIARSLVQDYQRKVAVFTKGPSPYDSIVASLYAEVAHDIERAFLHGQN